jgi:rhamnosyl/mannosyltransferase
MKRLRVLHVGKFYPPAPGGMERVVQLLCEGEQVTTDSRVLVANPDRATVREKWQGVDVTRVGSLWAIGSVGLCPAFPLELRRARRDVTVLHEPNPLALVADWLAAQDGPLVVWFHSEVLRPRWKYRLMYRPFLRRALGRASRIVVSSPRLLEAAELQPYREKCLVIPFGIDTARLAPTPAIAAGVGEIARQYPGRRVLFVGRLVPYKGVDVLVKAMEQVDATALVVGDGPERAALEAQAVQSGLTERVRFLGRLSDESVAAHLHACDLLVLPSVTRAETFGMVQLEAMACGKPVVSTNLPTGVPWVNRHGETGLVVEPNDHAALAHALNTLLDDLALSQRLGAAAGRHVEQAFTVERMTAQSADLYRQVFLERGVNGETVLDSAPGEIPRVKV